MAAPKSAYLLGIALLPLARAPLAPGQDPEPPQAAAPAQSDTAQSEPAPSEPAQPAEDDPQGVLGSGRTLELSLEAALRVAATNDIGLHIQGAQTEAAYYDAIGSWGAFDVVFSASGRIDNSQNEAQSDLDGAPVVQVDQQAMAFDFSRPLEWGGSFALHFDRSNVETNNQFATVNPSTTDILRVSYTQPLLRGFGWDYGTSQQQLAEVQFNLQRERERQARQDLLLATANAYWDLVLAEQQVEVADSSLELAQNQLARDKRVFEAGLGTEVEVLQSTAQVERSKELVLRAATSRSAAEDALKQILFPGVQAATWETNLSPITPLPEVVRADWLPTWTQTFEVAVDNRAEVRQRHLEIALNEIAYERAVNERRPGLDLDISAASQGFSGDPGDALSEAATFDFPTYGAALVFNTPLQNRTARNAVYAARANVRASKLALEQTQSQIVGQVRDAIRQLQYQAQAVGAAKGSVAASWRQLEAEQARNKEGISTNFQVLQFQDQWVQAVNTELTARVNFMKARAAFEAVQGLLGEDFE